jgi:radial spoke head protein 4A
MFQVHSVLWGFQRMSTAAQRALLSHTSGHCATHEGGTFSSWVPVPLPLSTEGEIPYEPYGEGANAYVYFVSNSLGGPVTQLPFVTPTQVMLARLCKRLRRCTRTTYVGSSDQPPINATQIKVSRLLRRFLTGHLDAPVSAYPAFPGNEANFLRALIARISAATVCCPQGAFTAEEDSPELSANDEWVPLKGREMSLPVHWSHRYPHLKGQGRTVTNKRDPPDEEEEPEKVRNPKPVAALQGIVGVLSFPRSFKEESASPACAPQNFWTAEEMEAGPPPLASLDKDTPLPAQAGHFVSPPAWSPMTASASVTTRNQVGREASGLGTASSSNRPPRLLRACESSDALHVVKRRLPVCAPTDGRAPSVLLLVATSHHCMLGGA